MYGAVHVPGLYIKHNVFSDLALLGSCVHGSDLSPASLTRLYHYRRNDGSLQIAGGNQMMKLKSPERGVPARKAVRRKGEGKVGGGRSGGHDSAVVGPQPMRD